MQNWLFLLVVALGGILVGAVPLLIAVKRRPRTSERAIKKGAYEFPSQWRDLVWFCLLPLVVYLLLWGSVGASLSWPGLLMGGALLAIVATVLLCVSECERKEDPGSDAS